MARTPSLEDVFLFSTEREAQQGSGTVVTRTVGDVQANTGIIGNMTTRGILEIGSVLKATGEVTATISSGEITFDGTLYLLVDTESGAASDDLDTISLTEHLLEPEGTIILLKPADDTHTINVRSGVGNIFLATGSTYIMDNERMSLLLIRKGDEWQEITRGGDPVPSAFPPFGLPGWSEDEDDDATITTNTTLTDPFKVYRDLTINAGIVLTGSTPVQVISCRTLTFGSTGSIISADGLGAAGATGDNGPGAGGDGCVGASLTGDLFARVAFADGGEGGGDGEGSDSPDPGADADTGIAALIADSLRFAHKGGGGGGAGAGGGTAIGGSDPRGSGGTAGGDGGNGGGTTGGGGGSGVGGGGGGGGMQSSGGGSGTGGSGGDGGGILIVVCRDFAGSAGVIRANGTAGGAATAGTADCAGGGGGGGGLALVFYRDESGVTPTVQANGGQGGANTFSTTGTATSGGDGGDGVARLIRAG